MGKLKAWLDDVEVEDEMLKEPDKYWRSPLTMRWLLIAEMETEHLESVVNLFSRDGWVVDPERQDAFTNVMIEYLKRKEQGHEHTKMSP